MKKVLFVTMVVGLFLIGSTGLALATHVDLMPGDDVASASEAIPGSSLITSLTLPFDNINGEIRLKGTLYQEVRRAGLDGNLIYVYWINLDSETNDVIERMSTDNFRNVFTEVAYVADGGLTVPTDFTRSSGSGTTLGFEFSDFGDGAESSTKMWIKTNWPYYKNGQTHLEDGGTIDFDTHAPSRIPEPTSVMLLGMGLIGFAGSIRRKFMA